MLNGGTSSRQQQKNAKHKNGNMLYNSDKFEEGIFTVHCN